ncbi:hypothetical protein [Erwinia mallotivora]|uniref:hypothetical protein n=1 Tax=Erwinia mallotivora TaxID=69222 RepID=UPI0021C156B2|nr:hypothetical protein [Erwinia mallotivora]
MPPVNPPTSTSSNNISRDSSNPEDQDIWFDAIDHVEMDDTWFKRAETFSTHEEHHADPSSSAGEAADSLVPFTEDCRRGVQQLVRALAEYGESRMFSAFFSTIFPATPLSLFNAANSLYTAVTERRNIDTAAVHALGLASGYLPEDINVVSWVASFIRDTVTGWTDKTFLQQFLGNEENHTSIHLFTALAVTGMVVGRWMKDEGAPQRGVLKVPAFMANIFIRASYYWTALGNMAGSLPSGAEIPENTGISQHAPAFEVDTTVALTQDMDNENNHQRLTNPSFWAQTVEVWSNSTVSPEAYTRATVQNRPAPVPGKITGLSIPERAHSLAVEILRQKRGLSDLLYCTTSKTETRQQTSENIITNYFSFIRKINASGRDAVLYSGTLTQDKRGEGYRSVEERIAQNVVHLVNWYDDGFQFTASYGKAFDARKSLLTYALVVANISDVNQLPDDWYKRENPSYLYWYLMGKLNEYTDEYGDNVIVDAARHFYERCNEYYPSEKNNKLNIQGVKNKEFKDYKDRHKLTFLRYYLQQEIYMEQSPETS